MSALLRRLPVLVRVVVLAVAHAAWFYLCGFGFVVVLMGIWATDDPWPPHPLHLALLIVPVLGYAYMGFVIDRSFETRPHWGRVVVFATAVAVHAVAVIIARENYPARSNADFVLAAPAVFVLYSGVFVSRLLSWSNKQA